MAIYSKYQKYTFKGINNRGERKNKHRQEEDQTTSNGGR